MQYGGKQETSGADDLVLGIDAGSVSINGVLLTRGGDLVAELPYRRHFGRVDEHLQQLLVEVERRFGAKRVAALAFTGSHGRKLSEERGAFYEFETISQALGAQRVAPGVRSIISMGGQDTALFQIAYNGDRWELEYFNTNGPCASGTGSFIDQQAQRLAASMFGASDNRAIDLDDLLRKFVELGMDSSSPSNVACRCTVFTKSDMIHLQNKGERLADIIHGLHVGNARNYLGTIVGRRVPAAPIIFIGGLSLNPLQVKVFREYFPALQVPPHSTSLGALGVALQALASGVCGGTERTKRALEGAEIFPVGPVLRLACSVFPAHNEVAPHALHSAEPVFLGIDIGSTSTKNVLMTEDGEIIYKNYVPTQGRPIETTQRILREMQEEIGDSLKIVGVATTGSGRNVVGDFLGADLIIDEITAHARGAVEAAPEVDTIFEIGGQDSKFISILNRHPLDFDMNKVCAAGTGSFLQELANKFRVNIVGEFEEIALRSPSPVRLAERCTVFMESDLAAYHQKGCTVEDLLAGLCYAVVHNYLNRVVGKRTIGHHVMFLGGPSLNKAVVAAFEQVLQRRIIVPRHREVLGAHGAALAVRAKMQQEHRAESGFRGVDGAITDRMQHREHVCHADPHCHNECKLKIYDFGSRRSVWGGDCGRYEMNYPASQRKKNYFAVREALWRGHVDQASVTLDDEPILELNGKPTVGIPRALWAHAQSVLWVRFFAELGLQPVLSRPTDSAAAQSGIESSLAETCFPIKVAHGHVRALAGKTRYVFLPSVISTASTAPDRVPFFCPMVQSSSYMIRAALSLSPRELLTPFVRMHSDAETLALDLAAQLCPALHIKKKVLRRALFAALEEQERFVRELHAEGHAAQADIGDQPLLIVTGRPYNLFDDRLNLRLGENLAKIGFHALPMDFVDTSRVDLEGLPTMYWGLGEQILRAARYVISREHIFGLHLTNFGCGPDSFIEHFYKAAMGEKPYLILELDEHTATAGVMTRLEAFQHVIENVTRGRVCAERAVGEGA